ncbi:MAG: 4Fe-4S dicluster domain-containing protein [Anaerolineae bacterium]
MLFFPTRAETRPLAETVNARTGLHVQDCYQCGKCSAGCPVSAFMDLGPHQIMRAVQLGQTDLALGASTIWLCTGCQTCATRCPMELDPAHVMDALRHLAREQGIEPAEKGVVLGNNLFIESIKRLGRLYEVGLVAGINLGTLHPFDNVLDVGLPLFSKGKLHLWPGRISSGAVARLFSNKGATDGPGEKENADSNRSEA